MWKKIKPYAFSILITLAVGGLSALLTKNNMDFYETIKKPPLAPPSVVFPVVWGILYVVMAVGFALVYTSDVSQEHKKSALKIYGAQLFVNFFWSIIFFNFRAFLFSYVWLMLLFALVRIMIIRFREIKKVAGYMQIPYVLWIIFAGYLNIMIWILNR